MFTKIHLSKKYSTNFIAAVIFAGVILVFYALVAGAFSKDDIVYPVAELDGCENETECRAYCDDPANIEVCVAFAKKHNLISQKEAEHAERFIAAGSRGPGGCDSAASCESYCNDINNIDECLAFAERTGLIPPDELEEARKVQAALASGATLPGGCQNKNECEAYCESPDHMEECIAFGEAAGFIPLDELEEAKKVLSAIKRGAKPPPCRGRIECETYCSEPQNMESCLAFAEEAGLMPSEELAEAKKFLSAIKRGVKPPSCSGREGCDIYCSEESHFEECLNFAEAAGFIDPEEAVMARKTGGKGPGNCRGREECETFCQDPANQEICFNFAVEHDLLSAEDKRRIEEGSQQILEVFENAPPEVRVCLENILGPEIIEGIRSGSVMPSEEMGQVIQSCFEQFMPKPEDFGAPHEFDGEGLPGVFEESGIPQEFQGQFQEEFQRQFEEQGEQQFERRFQEESEQFRQQFEGTAPSEDEFRPQEGVVPPTGSGSEFQQEFQQQFEQQFQQEFQRQQEEQLQLQLQQQLQQSPEGIIPSQEFPTGPTSMNPLYLIALPLLQLLGL